VSVIFLVLPLALLVVGAALVAWVWAARSGQFDDTETPASRVLVDDAEATSTSADQAARRSGSVDGGDSA
jgi:cbb3-type cytochrome oxidase maturation protein